MISHSPEEHVARAFYESQDYHQAWDDASEALKDHFRTYARRAISYLEDAKVCKQPVRSQQSASV